MRLQAALLLASCAPALAIFADEVNQIDYHHALLGAPQPRTTFFHRPSSSSSASLLYTLSDKSIIGAVNPKDGSVVWRQNISSSNPTSLEGAGFLRAVDGDETVFSAASGEVSSWGASDGKLAWTQAFHDGVVVDLALASGSSSQRDPVALFEGRPSIVRRLDGATGLLKWEYKDTSDDTPFRSSTSSESVYVVSLSAASKKGYRIKVTALEAASGKLRRQTTLHTENDVTSAESVIFVGSTGATPVIVWPSQSLKSLNVNVLGSKTVHTLDIRNDSGEDIRKIEAQASINPAAQPHIGVLYETETKSWAEVYHLDLKKDKVSRAFHLPTTPGRSLLTSSASDDKVYFTLITNTDITVVSSTSDSVLGTWKTARKEADVGRFAVSEVLDRGSGIAVRFAQISESGDWDLVRNGEIAWSRPESLVDIVAMAWADSDGAEKLAHELEIEGHQTLLAAYIHRLSRHIKDLQTDFPEWLRELPKRILTSFLPADNEDLLQFGFGKLAVVATRSGRVLALDSGRHGKVVWSTRVTESPTSSWDAKLITVNQGAVTVVVSDGSSIKLDVSTGKLLERTHPTQSFTSLVLIPGSTPIGIKDDGSPNADASLDDNRLVVSVSDGGKVQGWGLGNLKTPVWQFAPPTGYQVISATSRPLHDPVASIGKVLGDRSVLYKYLNPNLVLVTATGTQSANIYLLDGVSGQVLHSVSHDGVDTSQPIPAVISENWFAYSFWSDVTDTSDAKGYQLVISELYESSIPNDRGPLEGALNYSSIHGEAGLPRPHVISKAYVVPERISNMAVTQTRQGITIKVLLCTLPEVNAIVGIPRLALDPRQPVGRDPTAAEAEEGLRKYSPLLDFDPKWYLTHLREVIGIKHIESSPTLLESSVLVFAYGFDVFGTRLAPSQPFDLLGKGFSKVQLLLTVVALAAGVSVLAPMAHRKQVDMKWKA